MRTLAIGDIHGCFRSLDALAAFAAFTPEDRIITLGDYVDRGPDSRRVIEWLIDRSATGRLIPLRGNHELMMLAARQSERLSMAIRFDHERLERAASIAGRSNKDYVRRYGNRVTHAIESQWPTT